VAILNPKLLGGVPFDGSDGQPAVLVAQLYTDRTKLVSPRKYH
jgi:hypothetical protein